MRARLTDAFLSARATKSGASRYIIRDRELCGFECVIGARSRVFRLRRRGIVARIGEWPATSTDEARATALAMLRAALQGGGVADFARPARGAVSKPSKVPEAPTLGAVLADYMATRGVRATTAKSYRSVLDAHAADWLVAPVTALTADAFEARHEAIASDGSAAYLLRLARALCRFAAVRHGLDLPDPTAKVRALGATRTVGAKERFIPDEKLPAWFAAVQAGATADARDLPLFLLLTGARLSEARRLTWADVDLSAGLVTFKATKNGSTHRLPLGAHLRALLAARRPEAATGPVFGLSDAGVKQLFTRLAARCAVAHSAHDCRRTFARVALRTTGDKPMVSRLLNHAARDVTGRHYLPTLADDLCAPMQRVEGAFLRLWGACT